MPGSVEFNQVLEKVRREMKAGVYPSCAVERQYRQDRRIFIPSREFPNVFHASYNILYHAEIMLYSTSVHKAHFRYFKVLEQNSVIY